MVSQIYRQQNNRGDVSQSENTDVTITDKTDWANNNTDSLSVIGLFVVDLEWQRKYLRIKLLLAHSFNSNFF